MTGNPYNVVGEAPGPARGRKHVVDRAASGLSSTNASHLSIVGPPMTGKSPVLFALSQVFADGRDSYMAAIYWDLSHKTPITDAEFMEGLAAKVRHGLVETLPDIAGLISLTGNGVLDDLALAMDELVRQKVRVLVVLDEMDSLFRTAQLTRNLWDNLRDLAQKKSLRLATGSCARLRELCRTEESRTSDFWELFPNPVHLAPLTSDQIIEASEDMAQIGSSLNSSGAKEIRQWTGGHPALVGCFLAGLSDRYSGRDIGNEQVCEAADDAYARSYDILASIWDDLAVEEQMILLRLSAGEIESSALQRATAMRLLERGLVQESGSRVAASSRFALQYAKEHGPTVDRIATLFSDRKTYLAYIKPTLELRLKQIVGGDDELRGYIERALRDLHPDPGFATSWARNVSTRALRLIWDKESSDGKTIPQEWLTAWKSNIASDPIQRLVADCAKYNNVIPPDGGPQLRILRAATGLEKVKKEARYLTKPAFELLDFVHAIGDFDNHKDGNATQGVATSFCHAAVELFAALYEAP